MKSDDSKKLAAAGARIESLEERQTWLAGQNEAFRAAVNGAPLEKSLDILITTAVTQLGKGVRGAFYILDGNGSGLRHVVGMPKSYAKEVKGSAVGADLFACGLAVDTAQPVITFDVRKEPRWKPWLSLAEKYHCRGCWSFPVETARGKVVGTLTLYFDEPRKPAGNDLQLAESLCNAACIIIAQHKSIADLRESERAQSEMLDLARKAEEGQKLLLAELQHRVRNTLAVVKSIVRRTAESSGDVEEMLAHLAGRLDALARVQSAVTRNPDKGVDLTALLADELLAHAAHEGEQVAIDGPDIALWPKAAESFSLAIHELATNAVKHGALTAGKGKSGKIAVKWKLNGRGEKKAVHFEWVEKANGKIAEPTRRGFGMELLTRLLPYDLGAKTKVEFPQTGLRFMMELPVEHVAAQRATAS